MSAAEVYKVNAKVRFRAIWKLTKLTPCLALVAGCGEYSGQREPPPPPPAIAAGHYISREPGAARLYGPSYWILVLPDGGRTREADVSRCNRLDFSCSTYELPVRAGLNGLAISFPATEREPAYDLAISVTPDGPVLSYDTSDGLWEGRLYNVPPPPPLPMRIDSPIPPRP